MFPFINDQYYVFVVLTETTLANILEWKCQTPGVIEQPMV